MRSSTRQFQQPRSKHTLTHSTATLISVQITESIEFFILDVTSEPLHQPLRETKRRFLFCVVVVRLLISSSREFIYYINISHKQPNYESVKTAVFLFKYNVTLSFPQPGERFDREETRAPAGSRAEALCSQTLLPAPAEGNEAVQAEDSVSD